MLSMAGSDTLRPISLDEFVQGMLEKTLPMMTTFDRSDRSSFSNNVALAAIYSFYCAEVHTVQGVESLARANDARTPFFNVGFCIWERLMKYLALAEPPRPLMIALESEAKTLTLSESRQLEEFQIASRRLEELRIESRHLPEIRLITLLADTICHIWRLSPEWNKMDQRLTQSNGSAPHNSTVYERLPETPGIFRLVVLRPAISKNAPIDCVLCIESLNNNPQYQALSYTWGNPTQTREISVNKRSFTITENLFIALRHLRNVSRCRVIWVDALCINQNDIPERNQQVQHMRKIYRRASEVLIWLGSESNTTAAAIDFMTRIDWWITGNDSPDTSPLEMKFSALRPFLENSLKREGFRAALLAFLKFVERPWWGRVWVSQEYAMATKAHFLCGRHVMSLFIVEYFLGVWNHCQPLLMQITSEKRSASFHVHGETLYHTGKIFFLVTTRWLVQRSISQRTPVDITDLLSTGRDMNFTDPRDKVYALLGMTFESKYGDDLLKPNYGLDTKDVYVSLATHILSTRQTLDTLLQVCHNTEGEYGGEDIRFPSKRVSELPSWVPDWSRMNETIPIDEIHWSKQTIYQAGLDRVSLTPFQFLEKGLILGVKGVLVDTISIVGSLAPRALSPVLETWRKMVQQADDEIYFGSRTVREAFWRTILCDQWENDNKPYRLGSFIDGKIRFPPCTKGEEARLLSVVDNTPTVRHMARIKGRRFFRTEHGYIGMAPSLARSDDLVVVLLGGHFPFILRKSTFIVGTYDYIGYW